LKRKIEEIWLNLIAARGLAWLCLLPLSLLYGAGSLFLRRSRPRVVAGLRVISVGNLSLGGSGKTPLVLAIAKRLQARRWKVGVLTRGYGADEPLLLRKALPGLTVAVGADRLGLAQEARAKGCDAVILDDGFQRRHQLARDLDLLLLDWSRRPLEQYCLPAGRLREPLFTAREADAVIVTHAPEGWNAQALKAGLPAAYQGLRVFRGDHSPLRLRALSKKAWRPLSWLAGKSVSALSGIGQPLAFEEQLRSLGAGVIPKRFSDHHAYQAADLKGLKGLVVCTEKDAVKLEALNPSLEIYVLEMSLRVSPKAEFEALLES
jgi:tetraacyldisaccharide 4'-kinase